MPDIAKIKGNIASMIDQGAPETDIAAYLASEGATVQDLRGARMNPADEDAYLALAQDPNSTSNALQGFVRSKGFSLTKEDADAFIAKRARPNAAIGGAVSYKGVPKLPDVPPHAHGPNSLLQSTSSTAGEFLDGMLPGFGKTMAGVGGVIGNGISAATGGNDFDPAGAYAAESAASEGDKAQLEEDYPLLSGAAGWAGTGASFLLPGATVAKGESLAAHMANGGLTGSGYGVLTGAMNDSGDGRMTNAVNGGLLGGVLGTAAAPAMRGAANIGGAARRNVPGFDATANFLESIPSRLRGTGPLPRNAAASAQAERMLAEQMDGSRNMDAGMGTPGLLSTPANVADEVATRQSRGVPAMPADTAEDLRQTTAWALQGRGTMATRARQALSGRQAQQGTRIRQHLADELGPAVDPIAETAAIRDRVRVASEPGYRASYAQPMVITDEIRGIMDTPAFQDALPQAYRNIRNAQRNPQELGFRLHDDGRIIGGETLSTEGFDQVIRAMRDSGQAAMNTSGFRPVDTTNSVHINNRARDLRRALGDQNEPYRAVTENYADEMALKDGMELGGKVATQYGPEINAAMADMPEHAQEAYSAGARTALADVATSAGLKPTANVAQQVRQRMGFSGAGSHAAPGDPVKLQALENMTGRPGVMNRLDDRLEGEDQAFKTFSEASLGSKTQPKQAVDEAMSGEALGVAQHVATGNIAGAVSSILLRGNPKGTLRFKRDIQDRIAEIMTATRPRDVRELLQAVSERAGTDARFRASLARAGINMAKVATIQAAGDDTDPVPLALEDGQVLLGFQNDKSTDHQDAPIYGQLGTHYPPSH